MAAKQKSAGGPREFRNAKAHRDYFIDETVEAGIRLTGTEVKSIRTGKVQINDAFVRIDRDDRPVLYQAHIPEYKYGTDQNHSPTRPRELLLHKKEIHKLRHELEAGGKALIPLRMYFKKGLVKVELGLGRGKKLYDKREDLKKKVQMREAERAIARRR